MRGRVPSDGPIRKAEMNARGLDDFGGLATTQAWRVDAVCQRFEVEWRAGSEPRIEDFLPQADQPQRAALFRELLALELELHGIAANDSTRASTALASPVTLRRSKRSSG